MLKSAKKKNVCYFVYLLFTAVFLFTGCDNMFHKPVKSWFEKYTDTAAIELQELDGEYPQNAKGITCIPSGDSHTVTFYLRNPQNYVLIPGFIKTSGDPYDDSDVIIEQDQDDRAIIRMRYKGDFLKSKDQETDPEAKSLSGRVTLVESESERSFEEWPVELSANSVPLPVKSPAFQVDGSDYSTANYWVCFYMPKYSTIEDSIHKDTKYLIVNGTRKYIKNDTIYTKEECTTVDGDFTTTKPSGLGNLSQLNENSNGVDFDFDETKCPDGYQVMYYNTKHHPSTETYNVSFTTEDTEGLSSSISISNKAKQLVEPVFNVESAHNYQADEPSFLYKVTISHPFICTDDTSCGKGVTINYTITEENGTPVFADGTSSKLSGKATDKVTINLPKGKYKITADAVKNYYIASEKTEVIGVRVLKPAIYYISQTGNDAESTAGSSADPYRTIQYVIKKFFNDVNSGEYDSATNCYIYVMTNLTAPDDFNWEASEDAFVKIAPSPSYNGKITIKGSGGKRTIDLENNGKSGIFIAGGNVEIDSINLTNVSAVESCSLYSLKVGSGNVTYTNGSIYNCKGDVHGYIEVDDGKLTMSNVSVHDNGSETSGTYGALCISMGAEVECTDCMFANNYSGGSAGTIASGGTLKLTDCTITKGKSSNLCGAIYILDGDLTLTGVTIDGCTAGSSEGLNKGAAIYCEDGNMTFENVVIKNCKFNESATTPLGAAVYSEGTLKLKGKNTIINNTLADGTTKSNIYIPTTKKLTILGDITGSRIGINVPWTAGATDAPSVGTPVAFTYGYDYPETNSSKPGVIFTAENGYGITPITSGTGEGEAAFAVSSGAMYTALDYNFSFALKDVLGNTAHGFMPEKGASYTIVPTINRKETGSADPTPLYYKAADKELYEIYNETSGLYSSPVSPDNKVEWTAALWNGSYKVADLSVTSTSSGIKVSVPDTVTREDTYTIKLSVKYLGITHDASFSLVCDYSAENAASYIASLTTAGTYPVTVTGGVGPATTDGLAKVANAIKAKSGSGIYIKLDASETTVGGTSLVEYNDGEYFKDCTALKEIKLPDWMEFVIPNLFAGCTNLSSVTLSENTEWICQDAFKNCSSLTSISIPAGITGSGSTHGIAKGAFVGCKSGFKIIYAGTREQWGAVKRPSDAWHDGVAEPDETNGSVTCTDGKCGFDYCTVYIGSKAPTEAKNVGDVVFTDGSAEPYTSVTEDQKTYAIAVIFYAGSASDLLGAKTLGIGLVEGTGVWSSGNAKISTIKVEEIMSLPNGESTLTDTTTFTGDLDGSDNFEKISVFLKTAGYGSDFDDTGEADKYSAFYFAKNYASQTGSNVEDTSYDSDWYLPALAELYQVWKNRTIVDSAMNVLEGTCLSNNYYWSSSEYDWGLGHVGYYAESIDFGNNKVVGRGKNYDEKVRAIHVF